jgi:hypothetical protein
MAKEIAALDILSFKFLGLQHILWLAGESDARPLKRRGRHSLPGNVGG